MDDILNSAVCEACRRMRTRPSLLSRTVMWFAKTTSPYGDTYTDDPDFWLDVFLKLDHDVQLELLNDERKRTEKAKLDKWMAIKPAWRW